MQWWSADFLGNKKKGLFYFGAVKIRNSQSLIFKVVYLAGSMSLRSDRRRRPSPSGGKNVPAVAEGFPLPFQGMFDMLDWPPPTAVDVFRLEFVVELERVLPRFLVFGPSENEIQGFLSMN